MKKLISLALAVVMIISLSTAAFAETATVPGANTADVTGNYVAGWESNGIVYSVDIEWGDLEFTYHAEKGALWNPETLKYSEVEPAYWGGEGKITVTNRSNTKIKAVPEYDANEGYESAMMTFDPTELKVASAVVGTAQVGTITVTPGGSLPEIEEKTTIGTITLTISQDTDVTVEEARALGNKVMSLIQSAENSEVYQVNKDKFDSMLGAKLALDPTITEFESGTADQSRLNSTYETLLREYNICAALMGW